MIMVSSLPPSLDVGFAGPSSGSIIHREDPSPTGLRKAVMSRVMVYYSRTIEMTIGKEEGAYGEI